MIRWLVPALLLVTRIAASSGKQAPAEYYWPNVRGIAGQYGISNLTAPKDLSKPSWRWTDEAGQYGAVVVGGPVIDNERNMYFTTMVRLYKISPEGHVIWSQGPPWGSLFPDGPSIHDGGVFLSTTQGMLCKLSMDTGDWRWCEKYYPSTGGDSKYVTAHDGVVVIGTDNAYQFGGGSRHVLGINATDGKMIWDFQPDTPTWNNMGMFSHDDTFVLQDWDARVYRIGLHNGSLLWKNGGTGGRTWSDGGTILGANGVVYAASANFHQEGAGFPGLGGALSAYRHSDGELLWTRSTKHGVYTWPVAGQLHDDERWTVVIAAGAIPPCQPWRTVLFGELKKQLPPAPIYWLLLEFALRMQPSSHKRRFVWWQAVVRLLFVILLCCIAAGYNTRAWVAGIPTFPAEIVAFDAETGSTRWHYDLPIYEKVAARGDEEGWWQRHTTAAWRELCCPASFGSPSVDGNGIVYIGHVSGIVYAIKDRNADGWIDDSEVQTFDAEAAFLHSGPAFAPGLFAFSTCDSLWVWNT